MFVTAPSFHRRRIGQLLSTAAAMRGLRTCARGLLATAPPRSSGFASLRPEPVDAAWS